MGAASHDLRTPLASIKTAVSSLRRADVPLAPTTAAELLELIERQTDRLARLVANLLDMTRIEAGALEVRPASGGARRAGRRRTPLPRGHREPCAGRAWTPRRTCPCCSIDHVLMGQVLANLLENAERLSPRAARITVAARVAPGSASTMAEISVADQGPGIAREDRERVFEMFSQNGGGGRAGLGLAIAKAFVEAHGGLIWIDPDVETGRSPRLHRSVRGCARRPDLRW